MRGTGITTRRTSRIGLLLLLLAALFMVPATSVDGAELPKNELLDCNSSVEIQHMLNSIGPGGALFDVAITITNDLSTDIGNNPIDHTFDRADYFPNCASTIPCVPNAAGAVNFVMGSQGGTCPNVNVMDMGTQVVFDFVPDVPLGPPTPQTSCTIMFQERIPNPGTYISEVTATGVCDPSRNSSTTVTDAVTFVPTLGEYGFMILALILAGGSFLILRRRAAGGVGTVR